MTVAKRESRTGKGVSRRSMLKTAGVAGVAAAAAGVLGRPLVSYAIAGNAPKHRFGGAHWRTSCGCGS